ncbi:metalloprotease MEP1 [Colletotrichum graminicola M1.001]|uniref:Metalloprotease MEP1 n=1 Tax=Colletotrichum graminicola (strain M1.001 / M2 / FGSC 10212) TaxID=645133 RepID=E3QUW1_COLGM|nr:metalloprotease MEP1 [Colletotrichum graminicola M1.001]EFQ34649.1 metalloprotease MEP1 [Colletotrichum graminicola M1.001]
MFDTMKFSSLLANAAAVLEMASLAMAQEKCGSEEPGAEAYQAAVSLRAVQRAEGLSAYVLAKRAKGLLIMTYLHVVEDEAHRGPASRRRPRPSAKGAYDDLNIYFETGFMKPNSVTGLCSFPVEDPWNTGINGTSWYAYDGCHVSAGTMPGGPGYPWDAGDNLGKTATHEVGHWLGLFHVFEGFDCDGEGDLIDDTPPTKVATSFRVYAFAGGANVSVL